jgi:hypothetical protein
LGRICSPATPSAAATLCLRAVERPTRDRQSARAVDRCAESKSSAAAEAASAPVAAGAADPDLVPTAVGNSGDPAPSSGTGPATCGSIPADGLGAGEGRASDRQRPEVVDGTAHGGTSRPAVPATTAVAPLSAVATVGETALATVPAPTALAAVSSIAAEDLVAGKGTVLDQDRRRGSDGDRATRLRKAVQPIFPVVPVRSFGAVYARPKRRALTGDPVHPVIPVGSLFAAPARGDGIDEGQIDERDVPAVHD